MTRHTHCMSRHRLYEESSHTMMCVWLYNRENNKNNTRIMCACVSSNSDQLLYTICGPNRLWHCIKYKQEQESNADNTLF